MTQVTFQTTALATPPDGTNVDVNAGTNSDATQRVTIATDDALNTVLGTTADAASVSTSIKAALRAISTALGITALDLGSGTGGSRTLRFFKDTAQWIGGSGSNGTAVQRVTVATDDVMAAAIGTTGDAASATTSLSGKLRAIATALGTTALDLGSGTAGSRTLRVMQDTSQVPTLESSRVPVNTISGQAGVAAGSGSNGSTVQRVTVATDDTVMAGIRSPGLTAAISVTRPSNATTYTANDVVGVTGGGTAALDFNLGALNASVIQIDQVSLERDVAALISGETNYNLYLYNVTPPSALADNTAFDIPSGDRASFLGKIALGTPVDEGSTLYTQQSNLGMRVKLSGTHVFGYLATVGSYQPATATVHVVTLHATQL